MADQRVNIILGMADRVSDPLARVSRGFEHLKDGVHKVTDGVGGFTRTMLSMTGGILVADAVKAAFHGIGEELIAANAQAQRAQAQIGGIASLMSGLAPEETIGAARETWEALENGAIRTGVAIDDVTDAYQTLLPAAMAHGQSMQDATNLTLDMAKAAAGLRMDVGGLAQDAMMFEQGIGRARSPMIMMLRNMGILGRDAKALQSVLSPEKAEERQRMIAEAMHRMAGVTDRMPLTWERVRASIGGIREQLTEALGKPVFDMLMSRLEGWSAWLQAHRAELEETATAWGTRIAEAFEFAVARVKDAFEFLARHWDAIVEGMKVAAALWAANKARMMVGAAMEMGAGAMSVGRGVVGAGVGMFRGMQTAGAQAVAQAQIAAGGTLSTMQLVTAQLPAFGMAAAHVGTAAVFASGTVTALSYAFDTMTGKQTLFQEAAAAGADSADMLSQAVFAMTHPFAVLGTVLGDMLGTVLGIKKTPEEAAEERFRARDREAVGIARRFGVSTEDVWRMSQQRGVFIQNLTEEMFAGTGRRARTPAQIAGSLAGRGGPVIDQRGSTFNIKQDFRDQDPDRIAAVFTRDLARHAEVRRQSGYALAYGG